MSVPRPGLPSPYRALLSGVLLVVILGAIVLLRTAIEGPELVEIHGETMGTTYTVKVVDPDGSAPFELLASTTLTELNHIDATMSRWNPVSQLSRFNAWSSVDEPFPIDEELGQILAFSQRIHRDSGGAFDITVGPLMGLWGFHGDRQLLAPPDEETLAATRARCGAQHLILDTPDGTARKGVAGLELDLGGIAKGLAVDRVSDALAGLGYDRSLVEVGGELRARGAALDGGPWRIAIEQPDPARRAVHEVLELNDLALATSGDYRNFHELDGTRYSHTMDPRTGRPVDHDLASVTVLHERCADADGWATALLVLGPDEGFELAEAFGLAALFLRRAADGLHDAPTARFAQLVLTQGERS